jgi:hypothetical protein
MNWLMKVWSSIRHTALTECSCKPGNVDSSKSTPASDWPESLRYAIYFAKTVTLKRFLFRPWETDGCIVPLDLEGPPCGACKYWKPIVHFDIELDREEKGVTLCTAPDQKRDFSCFSIADCRHDYSYLRVSDEEKDRLRRNYGLRLK